MDYESYLRGVIALVAVLALIGLAAWAARRFGLAGGRVGPRRDRRLSVSEILAVDNRRRLVLIKRDTVEHLLLLGGADEIVVESGIVPGLPEGLPKVFGESKQ